MLLHVDGHDFQTFTYRAKDYAAKQGPLILVFHGSRGMRETIETMPRRWPTVRRAGRGACFDRRQFSEADYSYGKVMSAGRLLPRQQWTFSSGAPS